MISESSSDNNNNNLETQAPIDWPLDKEESLRRKIMKLDRKINNNVIVFFLGIG